jgi:pseudouridine synthase
MRLNKFLSQCGVASRRKADVLIAAGQVRINGRVVSKLGTNINQDKDVVMVAGRRCELQKEYVYIALNKPRGYVCTHAQHRGEKSIFELLPEKFSKLKIAGRLDKNSGGLVLLSNDGDFIYQLTHPKFRHEKEYEVILDKPLTHVDFAWLKHGVRLSEGIARADQLRHVHGSIYRMVLHQGWKRQIRRMFETVGCKILNLTRIREGRISLQGIALGKYKELNKDKIF